MHKFKPASAPFDYAQSMRKQALAIALKRKEEYLGARVPRELKEKVHQKAEQMGIPVSILIRKVLEEAFSGESPARSTEVDAEVRTSESEIVGWKTIELNAEQTCSRCGKALHKGSAAVMAVTRADQEFNLFCGDCKLDLQQR